MMRLIAFFLALLLAAPAYADSVAKTENVRAELLADAAAVKPGQPFWVALRQTLRPKWHTYWKNPGESGLPTEIAWTLPPGTTAGAIVWPTPHVFDIGGVINYGFKDEAILLVQIIPPADASGNLKLEAAASWLVCDDVCIPEEAKLDLTLPVTAAGAPATPETRALFEKARRETPTPSPWPARYGVATSGDPTLIVDAKGLKADSVRDIYFFPAAWGPIASMAKQEATIGADGIRIPLKRGDAKDALPAELAGTLVLTEKTADGDVHQAFDLSAKRDPAFVPSTSLSAAGGEPLSLAQALLVALLGGLILNLMPCVFPVLAMKAAAFARLAGHEKSAIRRDGLAYTLGVLAAFAAMAAVVIGLRAGVGEVSWGFQFQSPVFSLLIAYLFFVVGLNLAGVFEVGGRFAGVGQGLAARGGTAGAFFTGVLAVVVATPCTAPFMAGALGFALSQPAPQTVAVLLALGLGLALPYLLLSLTPALQRLMPRPGPWMDRLRQFLSFPMFASAVWMIWVLIQQTGADGAGRHDPDRLCGLAAAHRQRRVTRNLDPPRRRGRGRPAGLRRRIEARGRLGQCVGGFGQRSRRCQLRRLGALLPRAPEPGRRGRQAGIRRLHRRLVHHLPGQRARRAGDAGGAPRLRAGRRGEAEGRLDEPRSRDHIRAEGAGPRRRSALSFLGSGRRAAQGAAAGAHRGVDPVRPGLAAAGKTPMTL